MANIGVAIHCLVFQYQTSLASHTELSHIQAGLNQWMMVWTRTDPREEVERRELCALEGMWKRIGFMRHADEFWLLAQVTLDKAKYPLVGGDGVMSFFDAGNAPAAGVTYDDSDMKQVRDLISTFQNLSFR